MNLLITATALLTTAYTLPTNPSIPPSATAASTFPPSAIPTALLEEIVTMLATDPDDAMDLALNLSAAYNNSAFAHGPYTNGTSLFNSSLDSSKDDGGDDDDFVVTIWDSNPSDVTSSGSDAAVNETVPITGMILEDDDDVSEPEA